VGAPRRWVRRADVAWTAQDERVVVLDLRHLDRAPAILEGSSAVVWALLDDPVEEPALARDVADLYGVSTDEVTGSVVAFLTDLDRRGLVEHHVS